jgi:HEAT repeats
MEDTSPIRLHRAWMALAVGLVFTAGCTHFAGTTATNHLQQIRQNPDPNVRYLAYAKLAQPRCYENEGQKAESARLLISKLEEGREPVATRAVIVQTLGELRDPSARNVILKAVNEPEPVIRVQACRALGKVGRGEDATVLARVMATDIEDCKIAAIEAIGVLKSNDPRIAKVLVSAMQNDDPAIRLASLNALRSITGRDAGTDAAAWAKLLPPDPADPESSTLVAGNASTPPPLVLAPTATAPAYPPRPTPIVDPRVDVETTPANNAQSPGSAVTPNGNRRAFTPAVSGNGNYPSHNPNLPASPGGP